MAKGKSVNPRKARPAAAQVEGKPAPVRAFSDLDGACRYLLDRVDLERVRATPATRELYKLDRMRAILEALGQPQDAIRSVHVAGTKGKGSTCEMAATCLESCGYTVGLYTSPHLLDIRERIRINRRLIEPGEFVARAQAVAQAAATLPASLGEATFFELMTAMGFLHFAEQAVDVAVVEVGLGGLLDCTNVITPEVAAVTMIGYDHTQILGGTLAEIAAQKAGIFKPGVPALTIAQEASALRAIRARAAEVGAPLQVLGDEIEFAFRFEWQAGVGPHARVCLTTERSSYEHVAVPLPGEHQALNCGLALAILDKLSERGFSCPESKVVRGLEQVRLPGRFEMALTQPRVLLDGAHNGESIKALMKSIGAYLHYDSLVVVFGCAADKDADAILRNLATGADKVVFTQADHARAAPPHELARLYGDISGKMCQVAPTLPEALDLALRAVGRDDLLCVTGSFYLVGEAKRHLAALAGRRTTVRR